jgi:hypothetical protein
VEDRISELKNKMKMKEKTEDVPNNSRTVKGIYKNSATPSKDKT